MTFADDQALQRLMHEMEQIGRSSRGKKLGEYQVIEQASARLGMYPSYAYRLLFESKSGAFRETNVEPRDSAMKDD